MVACALTGNISGEATDPLGNIRREAMRQHDHATAIHHASQRRGLRWFPLFGFQVNRGDGLVEALQSLP